MMRCAVIAVAVGGLLAGPSSASDFSKLAEPSFGRSLLLSSERQTQVECAGLALFRAKRGQTPGKTSAARLARAVVRRVAIEVDDLTVGRALVEGKAAGHADRARTEPFWAEARQYLAGKCEPLFAAASQGDRALAAALGPVPGAPLRLPDEEQCLATADYVKETGLLDWDEQFARTLRRERFGGIDADERSRRQAIVDGGIAALREQKPDKDHLELMLIACFPTVAAAAKRLGPDISDQLER